MKLVILGGSGSGKGTQSTLLSDNLKIPVISVGDVLRSQIAGNTELGNLAKPYVAKGELVPDRLMIQFIKQRLLEPDTKNGWILEGYPRTAFQAEELNFLLEELEQKLDWAIYLKVSESMMKERSKLRGLPDDTEEVIAKRIKSFYDFTIPILDYYQYRNLLLTINGELSIEEVEREIKNLLR